MNKHFFVNFNKNDKTKFLLYTNEMEITRQKINIYSFGKVWKLANL
jgi:transposase-like protein